MRIKWHWLNPAIQNLFFIPTHFPGSDHHFLDIIRQVGHDQEHHQQFFKFVRREMSPTTFDSLQVSLVIFVLVQKIRTCYFAQAFVI